MSSRERMKQTLEQLAFPVYEGRQQHAGRESKSDRAPFVVVFLGSDIGLEDSLKVIRQWRLTGRKLIFVFSEAAERVLNTAQLIKRHKPDEVIRGQGGQGIVELVKGLELIFVPNLTQNTAAKLATGIQDDFVGNLLWQSLACNKPFYANAAGIEHAWFDIGSNPMMALTMQKHLETLKSYGVKFELPIEVSSPKSCEKTGGLTSNKSINGQVHIKQNVVILSDELSQRVITERHILSLEKGSRLGMKKGVKITPLAKEAARMRRIELLQMEEGNNL